MSITLPAVLACLWVVGSTVVAMQPMRRQYAPGLALLLAAPLLIGWLALLHGWIVGALAFLAFISMFRNPLRYFAKRTLGKPVSLPPELVEKSQ